MDQFLKNVGDRQERAKVERARETVRSAPRWRERERPPGARQGGESERDRQERAKVERARETVRSAPGWRERETELREHGCGSRPVRGQSESASFEMKGAFSKSRPVGGRAMRRIQQDRRIGPKVWLEECTPIASRVRTLTVAMRRIQQDRRVGAGAALAGLATPDHEKIRSLREFEVS